MTRLWQFLRSPERGRLLSIIQKILKWTLLPFLYGDYILSKSKQIYSHPKSDYPDNKVLIYVKHGAIDKYDLEVLEYFSKENFFIVLCSTIEEDRRFANQWAEKCRFGRDSSYLRDFARNLKFDEKEYLEILFLNDSMIWDVSAMPDLIVKLRKYPHNTIVFPTESVNPKTHSQPYLMYVVLDQIGIQKFSTSFEWVKTLHLKRSLIQFIEYRIQSKLSALGWEVEIMIKHRDLFHSAEGAYDGKKLNPTQHLWDRLPKMGIVGIKRSLIFSNPVGVPNAPTSPEAALSLIRKIREEERE